VPVAAETGFAIALGLALLLAAACLVAALRARGARMAVARLQERELGFRMALWASGQRYWDFHVPTARLRYLVARHDGGRSYDFSSEQADPAAVIHPEDLPAVVDAMHRHVAGETPEFQSEHRVRADSPASTRGDWVWIRARGRAVEFHSDGTILRLAGTSLDIGRSRAVERENRIASEVLRSMNEAVAVLDAQFNFLSVNPAFARITGHDAADVAGRGAGALDSMEHDPSSGRAMREALARDGRWSGEMWQRHRNGDEFLCAVEAATVLGSSEADGERMYVLMLSDITLHKRAEDELRYLANFDALTNLPNRSLFAERLSRAIVRARREGSRVAVLFLDLDRFKDINDSLGHAAGDRILRAVASRLQQAIARGQTVARLAGDEFTVILEDLVAPEDAERVAREVIMAFEAPLVPEDGQEVSVSASIGISLYPDHAQVPTELLKRADAAMYQAKAAGRRTWMRYDDSMEAAIRRRATLAGALHKALDRGELRVVYQPRQALASSRITGAEALLRWTSPEHGEVAPADFIPLAEENGMILQISEWVLREACLAERRRREHGLSDLTVSVNMSVRQLLRGDFAEVVRRVLDDTGVPP